MPSEEIVPLGDIENIARRHFVMGSVNASGRMRRRRKQRGDRR